MPDWLLTIIGGMISGGAISGGVTLIQFFVNRKDKKNDDIKTIKDQLTKIEGQMDTIEMDTARLQLMNLIYQQPESEAEIMKCAQHYFSDLKGDWYMTSKFNNWLEKNKVAKPEWFDENN